MSDFADVDFDALAKRHGTPFYLYDMDGAVAHVRRLRAALGGLAEVYYAIKANANRKVIERFRGEIDGIDLSSAGELTIAQAAGYDPRPMSFAGPGKTVEELEEAVTHGVGIVSLESPTELRRLAAIALAHGKTQDVTVRINPTSIPKEFAMKMGGLPSQFGISEEEVDPVVREILATRGVRLVGVHVYSGTQCLEEEAILANLRQTLTIADRIGKEHGVALEVVNLGGGFGVPYFPGQKELDHGTLARAVASTLAEAKAGNPRFAQTRFILELGRYLISAFGVYVARVIDVKETRGKRFVVLDGGMNHCFPATGNFGQLVKKNYPVKNLTKLGAAELMAQEVVGPLCTPIDSMARAIEMPRAAIDDLVAFMACGAYSYAASPILFLSHPTPLELVKFSGDVEVARERRQAIAFC